MNNIILDYDGTLHQSLKLYKKAFGEAYQYLVDNNKAKAKEWQDHELQQWLGVNYKEMWAKFMPELDEETRNKCSDIIANSMIKNIENGQAVLFPNVIETLEKLKEDNRKVIFLSNCNEAYMNAHIKYFGLDKYFCDFYCSSMYDYAPKYEIFNVIKEKHDGEFVVVGDRVKDIEVGVVHNIPSVACTYGYGSEDEFVNATYKIGDISELLGLGL